MTTLIGLFLSWFAIEFDVNDFLLYAISMTDFGHQISDNINLSVLYKIQYQL